MSRVLEITNRVCDKHGIGTGEADEKLPAEKLDEQVDAVGVWARQSAHLITGALFALLFEGVGALIVWFLYELTHLHGR